ncbi:MAG: Crp/Fnr family transcriptional regulator [Acidimicrobiia bacterium]|nr:Crp/Fnr family transcriptional regulator [Acidimicrobiia bacterium]
MADQSAGETDAGFLAGLDGTQTEAFLSGCRRRAFPAGTTLFFEGDPPDDVVLVEQGQVKISVLALDGREIVLEVIEPGVLMGELSAIDGQSRSASAVALTDCAVLIMPATGFRSFLRDNPDVQWRLLVRVIADLRKQSHRTFEFGVGDALGRVCRCLAEMADRYGSDRDGHIELESPLSQHDMAAWIGLSREAVVKALRTLRTLGLIENTGRSFVIDDIDALRTRADM